METNSNDQSENITKKWEFIFSSAITLCPILLGILLWNWLPNEMAVRFSMDNEAISYSSKGFAVFGIPIMMFICHLLCIIPLIIDSDKDKTPRKVALLLLWIVPVFSVLLNGWILLYPLF